VNGGVGLRAGGVPTSALPAPPGRTVAAAAAPEGARGSVTPLLWLLPAMALQSTLAALPTPLSGPLAGALPAALELSLVQGLVALALIAGGGWLIKAAADELDWNATPVCVDEPARALVTTGPFHLGRHPMYLGAVAVLAGTATVLGSPVAALVAAGYAAWIDLRHARREDVALHARFGPAWRAYAARTRRWL
jgi:protein-S-isoprenylcysteine O-methyltransferase Ste14